MAKKKSTKKTGSKKTTTKKPEKKAEVPSTPKVPEPKPVEEVGAKTEPKLPAEKPQEKKPEKKSKKVEVAVPKVVDKWFDELLDKAKAGTSTLPKKAEEAAKEGIAYLEEHREDLYELGEQGFREVMEFFGSGSIARAKEKFIRTKMGPMALVAEMRRSAQALQKATEARAKFEEQANAFITGITAFAANVIRTLLFG